MSTVANKFFSKVNVCPPAVKHIYIYPTKDTMISEVNPLLNYGMFQNILLNNTIKGDNAGLFGFSGINLSNYKISADLIASVKFHMAINQQTASKLSLKAQKITDNGWIEYGVTWAGQPNYNDTTYARTNVAANASAINMDLTKQFKAEYNTYFNNEFGLRITSESMIKDEMTVLSREAQYGRPCIDIEYYDYSETPTFISVLFDIDPEIKDTKDITFDLEVQGTNTRQEVGFDFNVPIYNLKSDIDFTFSSVQRQEPQEIGFDFTVPKFKIDPDTDITFSFESAEHVGSDIGFDLTVALDTMKPVDIGFTFASSNQISAEVGFDLSVNPDPTTIDIGFDLTSIAKLTLGEIGFDVTVSALAITPVEIGFTVDISGGCGIDIGFDFEVPKFMLDPTNIAFDFTVSHTVESIIGFDVDALARDTQDVDFDLEVIPLTSAEIGFDFAAVQHSVIEVGFDLAAAQRSTVFIGIDFVNLRETDTEVKFDVWPEIRIRREIGFSFKAIHVSATYGFIM